ncbi:unnamed protein product [Lactuca virosa]|uniref:Pectinesterase inhibitor domain-containing protein n=1 Tax=Lactuca virosa TaxID=75947 RepID=A0AAU9P688_9ASTR|nr:unnamed protein product [Lactuca virosa]
MSKSTTFFLITLSAFYLIAIATINSHMCNDSSNPEACKKTIEKLKKEKEIDPNNTIRKIINFGLQKSLTLKANMTDWVRHRNLRANEHAAIKGCLDDMDNVVDDLRKTLKEVDELAEAQKAQKMQVFMFHNRNIRTWLKTAINNLLSCQNDDFAMEGLEGEVKQDVLRRIPDLIIATRLAIWTMELPSQDMNNV